MATTLEAVVDRCLQFSTITLEINILVISDLVKA